MIRIAKPRGNMQLVAGEQHRRSVAAFLGGGGIIGTVGGLIGLGGAKFRLPLRFGLFRFTALEAIILNKAMGQHVEALREPTQGRSLDVSAS